MSVEIFIQQEAVVPAVTGHVHDTKVIRAKKQEWSVYPPGSFPQLQSRMAQKSNSGPSTMVERTKEGQERQWD